MTFNINKLNKLHDDYEELKEYCKTQQDLKNEYNIIKDTICNFTFVSGPCVPRIYEIFDNLKMGEIIINKIINAVQNNKCDKCDKFKDILNIIEFKIISFQLTLNNVICDVSFDVVLCLLHGKCVGDVQCVKQILQEYPNLMEVVDDDGVGVIHYCAMFGNKHMMKMLIEEFNANVDQQTCDLFTPILLAAKNDNIDCLIELRNHNANVNLTTKSGTSLLDYLIKNLKEKDLEEKEKEKYM